MTPIFRVIANGADITAKIADRLETLTVTDEAGFASDTAEIRIDNRGQQVATPPKGAELRVALGYEERGLVDLGLYTVDEVEVGGPPDFLVIKAKAADVRGPLKAAKTRSWHGTTLGSVVNTIAAEHGLVPAVGAALASVPVEHLDQTDESDLHLLTRLAGQHGAVAKPANGHLVFVPRGEAKTASGKALGAVAITATEVESWTLTMADRGKYAAVTASWHDQASGRKVDVRVGEAEGATHRLRFEAPTEAAARSAAEAKLASLKRGEATLSLNLALGRVDAAAEAPLTVSGLHREADDTWTATRVTHTFNGSGLRTVIEAEAK